MQVNSDVIQQPYVDQNQVNEAVRKKTKGLGITQVVIGALTIFYGVLSMSILNYWAGHAAFGIWGGIWVSVSFNYSVLYDYQ